MARYTAAIERRKREKFDLIQQGRSIIDKCETEKRDLNTEERAEFDKLNSSVADHERRIADMEKMNADDDTTIEDGGPGNPEGGAAEGRSAGERGRRELLYVAGRGLGEPRRYRLDVPHGSRDYRSAYNRWLTDGTIDVENMRIGRQKMPETRTGTDVIVSTQSQGGYLVAPVETTADIVKQIDNYVFIRQLARYYKVLTTQSIGVRQMVTRVDDSDWTTEIASVTADTSMAFGRRDLTPNILTKLVRASMRIVEAGVDAEEIVNEELAYKNAVTQEKAFLLGTGSGQPLGVYTASASGVPTSQDVTSGATADFIADDLIKLKYSLKQPYFNGPSCRFVMGRPIIQEVRTFKDGFGQYIWRPGLASDKPDTILDVPVAISEYSPVTKTTGSYIICLGNFSYYAIAEFADYFIQRLNELFAGSNEIGFISRSFIDGAPVLGEAFARLKTA